MRVSKPKEGEPIRLVETKTGHRYRVVLDIATAGAPRRQVTKTFDTLGKAREFVANTRAGIATGSYTAPSAETIGQLCTRWLESRRGIRQVTLEGYQSSLRAALRHVGHVKVQSFTVADADELVMWLGREGGLHGGPLSPRSVRATLIALGQVFDKAAREGTISRNVIALAEKPRLRQRVGLDLPHWQQGEIVKFRQEADKDVWAALWRITLCGVTRSEVCGLRWQDVDLDAGLVQISQGRVALIHGDAVDDPKSAARRRTVPFEDMYPGTASLLKSLRAAQAADRLKAGEAYQDGGLVLVDVLGVPVRPEVYSDRFKTLTAKADVQPINLHQVRHSVAFALHGLGVTPADAAALLGHEVQVHLSTYLPHSGTTGIAAAARTFGRAVGAE